ncbi:MAG: hypothetical protein U0793_06005 [Gemmataceae bacterium]
MRATLVSGLTLLLVTAPASLRAEKPRDPRPSIDLLDLPKPGSGRTSEFVQGENFHIHGKNFGKNQGGWVVEVFRAADGRALRYHLPVLEWTATRLKIRIPEAIPAGRYALHLVVPGRLLQSNQVALTVRAATAERRGGISRVYPTFVHPGDSIHLYFTDPPPEKAEIEPAYGRTSMEMKILVRRQRYIKAEVPRDLKPGVYKVSGYAPGISSGGEPGVGVRYPSPQLVTVADKGAEAPRGFRIDVIETATTRDVTSGEVVHLLGVGFGARADGKSVRLVEIGGGHAVEHPMNVTAKNWSDTHIAFRLPRDLKAGDYLVRIWDQAHRRSSNTLKVRVAAAGG